jgi:hypothetical protein
MRTGPLGQLAPTELAGSSEGQRTPPAASHPRWRHLTLVRLSEAVEFGQELSPCRGQSPKVRDCCTKGVNRWLPRAVQPPLLLHIPPDLKGQTTRALELLNQVFDHPDGCC